VTAALPLFRWVGGKRRQAERICSIMPERFGDYYEPFCGAGAVFGELLQTPRQWSWRAVLSDLNEDLINCYARIVDSEPELYSALRRLWYLGTNATAYYRTRRSQPDSDVGRAARFLYLQALSVQGLWRVNAKGQHNTPHSRTRAKTPIPERASLLQARAALLRAELVCAHVLEILERPKRGDLVYVDPPYVDTFTHYQAGGWSPLCAAAMVDQLWRLKRRGVHVIASDADNPTTRYLYMGAKLTRVRSRQCVAPNADARGVRQDLLIEF
jgi:DNA adenine methylase